MARRRNPRVDRDVRAALADVLATEVSDPRLALVTLTDVEVTPDHEVATVSWTTVDPGIVAPGRRGGGPALPPRPDQVAAALESAAPLLRGALGRRLRLRSTPELRFRPDPVAAQAAAVERVLRARREAAPPPGPDGAGAADAQGEP
jgi:ribosome-binding factor A